MNELALCVFMWPKKKKTSMLLNTQHTIDIAVTESVTVLLPFVLCAQGQAKWKCSETGDAARQSVCL